MEKERVSLGQDIHAETAAKLFAVPKSEVTREQRRAAKAILWTALYGVQVPEDAGVPAQSEGQE
jgi:DNA polymerase I-like protein with 3'-5' exonuclease and polymerase domains